MILKTKPCQNAVVWSAENGCKADLVQMSKADFDKLFGDDAFKVPPLVDSFGDGHGEPYNPYRQAFGKLKDGRFVYCETHDDRQEPDDE